MHGRFQGTLVVLMHVRPAAVQILVSRETSNNSFGHPNLLPDLLEAGVNCQGMELVLPTKGISYFSSLHRTPNRTALRSHRYKPRAYSRFFRQHLQLRPSEFSRDLVL